MHVSIRLPNTRETFEWLDQNLGNEYFVEWEDTEALHVGDLTREAAQMARNCCPMPPRWDTRVPE